MLIEDCSNGRSKFNLLVQIETVADTFHRLTGELSTLLDVFPLQELHLNDDVQELVILLRKQCSESIPFVEAEQISCIGVDNMCIIVDVVKRQPLGLPTEEKISNAMGEIGPSITLASLSEILAFAVGSFVSMPACHVFSMIAALVVLLDFLLQITAFVALVTLEFNAST
ncbi:NPC intracellular cholesterol transporter 1 homolog 1b-like [Cajanus cajan]|uniref:NPC intracellular cholesterol transporter 1 homolog 1b-like n=1 Tax=Cajanus cajan TaxID=3821 RepID=UPI00098DAE41|nr:NPC intracellular cholesterol transporter 1 homolog 1b-like [Cajanus cajan]